MVATAALGALAIASCGYYFAAIAAMLRHLRRTAADPTGSPDRGVSVLKPIVGAGPEVSATLRSHLAQDHSRFELLVGTAEGDGPARASVRELQSEFPDARIELVECSVAPSGCNGKVAVLEELARHARWPLWVMSDADIRVPCQYLRTVCAEIAKRGTGLITCLYSAEPGPGLGSRLQAIRINTEFPGQVTLAGRLQGMRFALGSTVAVEADTLRGAGGLAGVRYVIGDDYHLGAAVAAAGLGVELSSVAVQALLPSEGWSASWARELRWSRTIRRQRPVGHACLPLTFGVLWAIIGLAVFPGALWPLASAALALRFAAGAVASAAVGSGRFLKDAWLLPVADLWAFAAWLWSYFGNTVQWAGRQFRLGPGGRILETGP